MYKLTSNDLICKHRGSIFSLTLIIITSLLVACGGDSNKNGESYGNGTPTAQLFADTGMYYFTIPKSNSNSSWTSYSHSSINQANRLISTYYFWNNELEAWEDESHLSSSSVEDEGRLVLTNGEWVFRHSNNSSPLIEVDSGGDMLFSDYIVPLIYYVDSQRDLTGINLNTYFEVEGLFAPELNFPTGAREYNLNYVYLESAYLLHQVIICESSAVDSGDVSPQSETEECNNSFDEVRFYAEDTRTYRAAENFDELILATEYSPLSINDYYVDFESDGTVSFYEDYNREVELTETGSLITEIIDGITIYRVEVPSEYDLGYESMETFYTLYEGKIVEGLYTLEDVKPGRPHGNDNAFLNETAAQVVLDNFNP